MHYSQLSGTQPKPKASMQAKKKKLGGLDFQGLPAAGYCSLRQPTVFGNVVT